ncbi:MAG: cytochrome c biogenesis protein ResB [Nostocoides sp.]
MPAVRPRDTALSSQPTERDDTITQPTLDARGWFRFIWRQLTSMRTALMLLLALAVASLPGSVLPQRGIDAGRTADWIASHTTVGPLLDRLDFFDVFAAPWFAAIYLLLFVSLVGCVLPRSLVHWRAMRARPPRAPKRLDRLAAHTTTEVAATPQEVLDAARTVLRGKRFRVHSHDAESVSSEGGHLKETGNLVFHLALIGVIIGVAVGHIWGWKGDVIVPEGDTFANSVGRFATFAPGPWVNDATLAPFTLTLHKLEATFEESTKGKGQFGTPRDFTAFVTESDEPGAAAKDTTIKVNHPLSVPGATVFLLGNGYAPKITVRDALGDVLYSQATPFLARDNNYTSVGAVKVPAAQPDELGFSGLFLPTAVIDPHAGPVSVFPQALKPALALTVYEGDLNPGGRPQSVYTLDTASLTQLRDAKGAPLRIWLEPGQTYTLPGGRGSITFDDVTRFAGLSIRHDPGKWVTLGSAILALGGLIGSLLIRRRRIFVRVSPAPDRGRTLVSVGGLAKDDDDGMPELLDDVVAALHDATGDKAGADKR